MAQPNSGIGNVTTNMKLVEMAMAYSRSRVLCAIGPRRRRCLHA